jgi:DNA-binding CsgD family transcriptional regulator
MRYFHLLINFLLVSPLVIGQNSMGLPLVKNFSKIMHGGGSQTWDIDQDRTGRMYFANNEGLLTFDGVYWKKYPLPNRTIVRSVKVDASGKIYVGGQGEVGYFTPDKTGNLEFHSILNLIPERNRVFADVWDIEFVGESVFFRSADRIMRLANQKIEVYLANQEWVFMQKVENQLFIQDKTEGLFSWSGQVWKPEVKGAVFQGDILHGALTIGNDSIVFITFYQKVFLRNNNKFNPIKLLDISATSEVVSIIPVNKHENVIATTGEGCWIINKQGGFVQQISQKEGLQENSILSIFCDINGNIWTGLNNGISLIAYNAPIKFIKPNLNNEVSGYASKVFNNRLFIATNNGAYYLPLDSLNRDLSFVRGNFSPVAQSNGLAYRFDEVNQHLLMAHNDGTFFVEQGRAQKLSADPAWLFLPISQVIPSKKTLVGNYTGLKWLEYAEGNFKATSNLNGLRESFRFLVVDNEQQVWASHPYRGIYKIHFSADSLSFTAQLYTEEHGLPNRLDNHVFKVKNRIVFATSEGIYEYNKQKDAFEPSPLLSPMFGNTPIRYLSEDRLGNLWFVSEKKPGYLAFNSSEEQAFTITYFPEINGQILSGFENFYAFDEENVFVASERGVIHINPKKYFQNTIRPSIILSSVHALGKSDSVLHHGFNSKSEETNSIKLSYNFNSLHFEYSSPAYVFQENMEYSYILEGYDDDWSKWNTKPEKDYTNLPSGNYVFRVKGKSNLGIETEEATFSFFIAPPWYKSKISYAFYLAFIIVGIYLLNQFHKKQLNRQQQLYEEKQEQLRVLHQLEIEKNEKEIIRLQNEKLANEVSFKNKELADTTMHLVERGDALVKVKESLQKLHKANPSDNDLKRAIHLLTDIEKSNTEWDKFSASFDEINNDFLKKMKANYPALTNNDLKLCAYLQLKMSSKEISQLLNISLRGVEISRYRLRKKLGLTTEVSLGDFFESMV